MNPVKLQAALGGSAGEQERFQLSCRHRLLPPPPTSTAAAPPTPAAPQGLTKLLGDAAPGCMKEQKFENYFGRKIAVDASMHIYAFLVRAAGATQPRSWRQGLACPLESASACPAACMFVYMFPPASTGLLLPRLPVQVVVGRQGDQMLTSEAGDVTRWVGRLAACTHSILCTLAELCAGLRHVTAAPCVRVLSLHAPAGIVLLPSPHRSLPSAACKPGRPARHAHTPAWAPPASPPAHAYCSPASPGSHLQGMFFRTARMLEAGMKPV